MTDRFLVFAGGLCGAAGVALSAVAAHAGGGNVETAASFLLMHAPAFLAIGLLGARPVLRISGIVLLFGLLPAILWRGTTRETGCFRWRPRRAAAC